MTGLVITLGWYYVRTQISRLRIRISRQWRITKLQ